MRGVDLTDAVAGYPVAIDEEFVERAKVTMKRCQIGCGGKNALDDAHDILAECYGTIGRLLVAYEQANK